MNLFGDKIKQLREHEKLSVRKLAEKAGLSHSYLSQLENGKRSVPKPQTILKISKALKTPYSELMIAAGYLLDRNDADHVLLDRELIGLKIKVIREERGISLQELEDDAGLTPGYISELESGKKKNPTPRALNNIAESLGMSYAELIQEIHDDRYPENLPESADEMMNRYKNMTSGKYTLERPVLYPLDLKELIADEEPAIVINREKGNKEKIKFQLLYADQELSEEDKQFLLQVMDRTMKPRDKGE